MVSERRLIKAADDVARLRDWLVYRKSKFFFRLFLSAERRRRGRNSIVHTHFAFLRHSLKLQSEGASPASSPLHTDTHTHTHLLFSPLLPLVLRVLQHLLPPEVEEVGRVGVELEALLPVVPAEEQKEQVQLCCGGCDENKSRWEHTQRVYWAAGENGHTFNVAAFDQSENDLSCLPSSHLNSEFCSSSRELSSDSLCPLARSEGRLGKMSRGPPSDIALVWGGNYLMMTQRGAGGAGQHERRSFQRRARKV